ncbi:heme exporter protein CcmB [Pseudomonas oryzihabitans]|uniref:heme exporter protein CcmB n=1 Tax=Pseudomonas oryzihabitans TaxID=47885 RepID=UPI0028958E06|nr:heme exporter protein CcmB [Pseudomonas oryzihabitans]MDT3718038.1 heme exporter protein CcmB [Pseudomonas oryzihabitans]
MIAACLAVLRREWRLACRRPAQWLIPLAFHALIVTLFPLALGPDGRQLALLAPGLLWIALLLALLLGQDGLFRSDWQDGSLELWLLAPQPLALLVLLKLLVHWCFSGLALVALTPLLGLMLGLPAGALPAMLAALTLGSLALTLIGAIGAALTVGLARGGLLLALLNLPLQIPVLILGTLSLDAARSGLPVTGYLLWLGCFTLLALTLAPLAVAAGLRIGAAQ